MNIQVSQATSLPLHISVSLEQRLNLCGHQFSHLQNGVANNTYLVKIVR